MIYKRVGKIKEELSAIGYGCWGISGTDSWTGTTDERSIETIRTAIAGGVNFFDVAPVYGLGHAEKILGKAIRGQRERVFIASKCGLVWDDEHHITNNLTPDSVEREIHDSLKRLNIDYIDLYQCHWPDPDTDIVETMKKLNELKERGLIRYIGLTNFSVDEAKRAMHVADIASMQGLYNLLERNPTHYHGIPLEYRTEDEIFPFVRASGMAFFPYSPIFQGLLADKFTEADNFDSQDVRNANPKLNGEPFKKYFALSMEVRKIAFELGRPTIQVALNYLIQKEAITSVIAGALSPEQVRQNMDTVSWQLDEATLKQLNRIVE